MKNMLKTIILGLAITSGTLLAAATPPDSTVLARVGEWEHESGSLLTVAWNNPAVNQLRRDYSLSHAGAGLDLRHESEAVDAQRGDHERTWRFDAATHMKHRASTLWGHAGYENSITRRIRWNETSDPALVQPYVLADAAGGDMKGERYSFMGGYASHSDAWLWGGELGYTAGLYYRDVDPRPRNVTGLLEVSAGGGRMLGSHYVAALALHFAKYKQTNNVAFYSELGNEKLFHLTGLGNDYGRFAGTAYSTYYKGYRWGATVNLHPRHGRGVALAATLSRLTLDNILTTLNKLPMARLACNEVNAQATWVDSAFSVGTRLQASRRVGTENIFGDATASVYPLLTSLDYYHENRVAVAVEGAWTPTWGRVAAELKPWLRYRHFNAIYAMPQSQRQVNTLAWGLQAGGGWRTGRVLWHLSLGVAGHHPTSDVLRLAVAKPELGGLTATLAAAHRHEASRLMEVTAGLHATVALTPRYALRAAVDYGHGRYHAGPRVHQLAAMVAVVF